MLLYPTLRLLRHGKILEFFNQFKGRSDLIAYAQNHHIPVTSTTAKPYSVDANLLHVSHEGGKLEDPGWSPDESVYSWTNALDATPQEGVKLALHFEQGIPVAITDMIAQKTIRGSLELFEYLNTLAALHGIGRCDMIENRFVGLKSRGVYETPAGTVLYKAHRDLEGLVLDREVAHLKDSMAPKIGQLIYNGFWFSPEMAFLMAAIHESQQRVTGTVEVTLHKGNVIIHARTSSYSLYNQTNSSMDEQGDYNPADAQGFIRLHGLRLKRSL